MQKNENFSVRLVFDVDIWYNIDINKREGKLCE